MATRDDGGMAAGDKEGMAIGGENNLKVFDKQEENRDDLEVKCTEEVCTFPYYGRVMEL